MVKYVFREDEPLKIKAANKADAQVIGRTLAAITKELDGRLTPQAVVDKARAEDNPLHQHFEWDDSAAAEAFRLDQARNIIRVVRVVDGAAREGTFRAYVSIADGKGTAYRAISEVKSSADLQDALMKQADRDLEAFQRRYRELTDVCELVAAARKKIEQRRAKTEAKNETRQAA